MRHIRTFESYKSDKNYKEDFEQILKLIMDQGFEYEDLYITDDHLYFYLIDRYPFSLNVHNDIATVIVEKDGVTDNLGSYDIDDYDSIIDTIVNFK